MRARCDTCRWWDTSVSDGRHSEFSPCRVSPPVIGLGSNRAIWPMVEGDDWCGSHAEDPDFAEIEGPPAPPPFIGPPRCGECGNAPCDCIPF